jgi:hypothetical protein
MAYDDDIKVDVLNLDKEWQYQSELFLKYSKELADKKEELAKAEEFLEVVKAEAGKRARLKLKDNAKATEGMVKEEIALDQERKDAATKVIYIQHDVDILTGVVRAFDQRKAALEHLVTLLGQQYFSRPSVPYDVGREYIKHSQERRREIARDRTLGKPGRNT